MSEKQTTHGKEMSQDAWDLLYLMDCALNGSKPEEDRVVRMNLEKLRRMSVFHNIEVMICMALEETEAFRSAGASVVQEWKKGKGKSLRKSMLMDAAKEQVLAEMEAAGIWYMPLKGSILQDLYPHYGMRQKGDIDILYDTACRDKLKSVMKKCGLEPDHADTHHEVFLKPSVCYFEMHSALFGKGEFRFRRMHEYYKEIHGRLLGDEESRYGRHLSDEDFYIYMVAHMYKHYRSVGTGLRSLADVYIYIWKKEDGLDWDYIMTELGKLGLETFETEVRGLSRKLFGADAPAERPKLTDDEESMLSEFVSAGVYGTSRGKVERRMKEVRIEDGTLDAGSRRRYIFRRMFPDMEWFRTYKPFYAKHKICIPFFLVYRIFRQLFCYRKGLMSELHTLREMGKK